MTTPLRAILGYVFLLFTVRILARRPGAQLTLSEFVIVFLIGGVIIRATVGEDRSVVNCGSAILTVALLHTFIAWLKGRSPRIGKIIDGTPLVLLDRGKWRVETMDKLRITPEDVMAAARGKGAKSFQSVRYAILERNGGISIVQEETGGPDDEEG
jgi:uncharacterized membrane protein YcaP (DUF421 family)